VEVDYAAEDLQGDYCGRFPSSFGRRSQLLRFVVANGVGGGRGGSIAAEITVTTFLNRCGNIKDDKSLTAV
jgi:hypothetical protein